MTSNELGQKIVNLNCLAAFIMCYHHNMEKSIITVVKSSSYNNQSEKLKTSVDYQIRWLSLGSDCAVEDPVDFNWYLFADLILHFIAPASYNSYTEAYLEKDRS